ncbi:MAG: OmpA family protein [Candidatus Riflebacteria bacterium]|nr:OmpA family protein [Candidatus Riflebacteria bacterium]
MGNVTQPALFPILKSIELKRPNRQNTNLDFVPKPLFNTPPPAESEYIPPALAGMAQTGRINLDIVFAPNSTNVPASAFAILREVVMMLRSNELMKITIEGHTDNFQSSSHNLNLSVQRANSVKSWLVKSGVRSGQVKAVGYGETRPIADNSTSEGRAKNRRVEIVKN